MNSKLLRTVCMMTASLSLLSAVSCGSSKSDSKKTTTTTTSAPEVTTSPEDSSSVPETKKTKKTKPAETTAPEESEPDESSIAEEEEGEITSKMFESKLSNVVVEVSDTEIWEYGTVDGTEVSFTIELYNWEGYTTPEDMVNLSRLFWQSYPKMYRRFSDLTFAPTAVTLAIENEGYEIAESGYDYIHLHDMWLYNNPGDYDCITHELGHIAQDGVSWNDAYLEYSSLTELFVDCLRYEYALDDGLYNDKVWVLHNVNSEFARGQSVRFLVWLDYMYSSEDKDLLRSICYYSINDFYTSTNWSQAWTQIFSGTDLEGKTIDEVWAMYAASDFAFLSSYSDNGQPSELISKYDIRTKADKLADR